MRLGKPLEHLQAALRTAQNTSHFAEQITTIGRQLAYAGYLTYDSIVWVSSLVRYMSRYAFIETLNLQASGVKFINLSKETKERVGKIANRFWLAGILFNLAYALLEV